MTLRALDDCEFVTGRLQVGPWRAAAQRAGLDLTSVIAELLTDRTTVALPESWQGTYTVDRARAWIEERDAESPTLLVMEAGAARPVGLLSIRFWPESMISSASRASDAVVRAVHRALQQAGIHGVLFFEALFDSVRPEGTTSPLLCASPAHDHQEQCGLRRARR